MEDKEEGILQNEFNDLKKFLFKLIAFISIPLVFFLYFSFTYKEVYSVDTNYMASIIDKHKRLEEIDENRLLLVGGSNLAFGINSELIEKELNINVVNLGLHAGLGLEFILNQAISSVKKGDIVLLSIEYRLYGDYVGERDLISLTQNIYPKSKNFKEFNLEDIYLLNLQNVKKYFKNKEIRIDSVYNRKSFNKYGDEIGHLSKLNKKYLKDRITMNKIEISEKNILLLRKLYLKCNTTGSKLYIAFPNYPISEFNKNKETIYDIKQQLQNNVSFIELINEPETFVYDDSLFYDTIFHLNVKGREKRTKMLIDILRQKFLTFNNI